MAGFVYYVSEAAGNLASVLTKRFGLAETTIRPEVRYTTAGPDGTAGHTATLDLSSTGRKSRSPAHDPADQRWRQFSDFWLGVWTADPPTPADLARPRVHDGDTVRLGDGRDWTVPAHTLLPRAYELGEDGRPALASRPVSRFDATSEIAEWTWERFFDVDKEGNITLGAWADLMPKAAAVLGLNYYLCIEEAAVLELLDTDTVIAVLKAFIQLDQAAKTLMAAVEAEQKKSPVETSGTGATASGEPDLTGNTVQESLTSN